VKGAATMSVLRGRVSCLPLALLVLGACSASSGDGAPGPAANAAAVPFPPPSPGQRLPVPEILAAYGEPPRRFEVTIDRCHGPAGSDDLAMAGCPVRVRLLVEGSVSDVAIFGARVCGAPASGGDARRLGVDSRAQLWSSTAAGCAASLAAQPVRVAGNGGLGLLIADAQGAEPAAPHEQRLFVERGGKLFLAWSSAEEENARDVTVEVVPSPIGRHDDLVVTRVVPRAGDPEPIAERIVARRLHWNVVTGRMLAYALPDTDFPLYLSYLGPFKTAVAARAFGAGGPAMCALPSTIFPGALFPGLRLTGYLRGDVVGSAIEVEDRAAVSKAGKCPPALEPKVIEYVPRLEFSPRAKK
jgi:hypothetical protein